MGEIRYFQIMSNTSNCEEMVTHIVFRDDEE